MNCPHCGEAATTVVDSRTVDAGISRRRECEHCRKHFNTYERVQQTAVMVIKRDGRREEFQPEKLRGGLRVCARKRPLPADSIDAIVEDIERRLAASGRSEVPSRVVGEMAITHLKQLDPITYIRFASAYRQFVSLDDMLTDLAQLASSPLPPAEQPRLFEDDFDALLAGAGASEGLPSAPTPIESARSANRA